MRKECLGLLLVASAPAGCVEVNDPCGELAAKDVSASLQLGTGETAFLELEDGQVLEAGRGPQGGFHIYGSLQARGIYPGPEEEIERYFNNSREATAGLRRLNPIVQYSVVDQAGEEVANSGLNTVQEPLFPGCPDAVAGCEETLNRSGDLVFMLQGTEEEELEAMVVDFSVTVTDLCGRTASDARSGLSINFEE